jgi:hypothetical protein
VAEANITPDVQAHGTNFKNTAMGNVSSPELTTMAEEREVIDHLQRRGEDGGRIALTRRGVFQEVNIWLADCCITYRKPSPWRFVHLGWSSAGVRFEDRNGKVATRVMERSVIHLIVGLA